MNLERGMLNRDSLKILTGSTGSRAFPTIDLNQAITQAVADARTKYHKLRVSIDRNGIRIQSEHGYFAVSGSRIDDDKPSRDRKGASHP